MPITPLDIRKKTFATQLRGFAPAEVKAFLALVADELEELRKERGTLVERLDELTSRLETFEKTERLLHETLVTAQKATGDMREAARHEAEAIVAEAEARAKESVRQIETQAQDLRDEVRLLRIQRANLVDEISGIAHTYLAMVERHRGLVGKPARSDGSGPTDT
jgi:cell division initiation protein